MDPKFELWDTVTGNLIGIYDSILNALDDLADAFPTDEDMSELSDYALLLRPSATSEPIVVLGGESLYRLRCRQVPVSESHATNQSTTSPFEDLYHRQTTFQTQAKTTFTPTRDRRTAVAAPSYTHISTQELTQAVA
jgi:hypothetical protein